jgi:superfamily II DNA or RNA helicase
MKLHKHQETLVENIRKEMRLGKKRVLAQSPTGSGKTVIAAHMIDMAHAKGKSVWFICNRQELIDQTARKLYSFGVPFSYIAAGYNYDHSKKVHICSIQTLNRRFSGIINLPDMVYWDECRMIASPTCSSVFWNLPKAYHVGLDATPCRLSGEALGDYFESMVHGPSVRWLINNGFLCDYKIFAPKVASFENVKKKMGDYDVKGLDEIMNQKKILGNAVKEYQKHASGLRNLVFCNSIIHSENLCNEFKLAGIEAASIDGSMKDTQRKGLLQAFESGKIKVLTSVDLVTAGLDIPNIECVTLERATQSTALAKQMIGRGLRTAEGKSKLIILDHVNMWSTHGLPCDEFEWTLDGKKKPKNKTEKPVKMCEKCYFVYDSYHRNCPECGFSKPVEARKQDMEHTDDELSELNLEEARLSKRKEQGMAQSKEELYQLGISRGYQPQKARKWAHYVFQGRQAKKLRGL